MQTRKIIVETDQYYAVALVNYTVDQEGDGIDSPVMVEIGIDEIEFEVCEEDIDGQWMDIEPNEEVKLLIETEFRK